MPGTTPGASATATSLIPPTGAPTTPVVVTPVPTTVRPATYTLQAGEYPFCLARRFNVDPVELLTLNGLTGNEGFYAPGLVLKIPQTGNTFPGQRALRTHPTTYIIAVNDTIYKIGCYFGDVDPLAVAAVNHLVSPYALTVGQSLSIP
jgi:LysM repeat protein